MTKAKAFFSMLINLTIFGVTSYIVVMYFFVPSNIISNGWESFRYFTTDSNILAAAAALVTAVCDLRIILGKANRLPHFAQLFKYIGTVCLMLTFATVMIFLMPNYGLELMISGTSFHMHVFAPLASLLTFVLLEKDAFIFFPETFYALAPIVIYGAVYIVEVVYIGEFNGGWMDFYLFNRQGQWMSTMIIMLAGAYIVCLLVRLMHNIGIIKIKGRLTRKERKQLEIKRQEKLEAYRNRKSSETR